MAEVDGNGVRKLPLRGAVELLEMFISTANAPVSYTALCALVWDWLDDEGI